MLERRYEKMRLKAEFNLIRFKFLCANHSTLLDFPMIFKRLITQVRRYKETCFRLKTWQN